MKRSTAKCLISCALFSAALMVRGENVDLHLQPDIASPVVATVSADSPLLDGGTAVLDEARAALGWQFTDYSGMTTGYVPDAKIGKDLLPVENAIIYSRPEADSPVLTVFRKDMPLEIVDTGLWWELRLEASFPVYFVSTAPPELPAVTGIATVEAQPAVTESPALPPASPSITTDPVVDTPAGTPATAPAFTPSDRSTPPAVGPLRDPAFAGQSYEGIFKRSSKRFGLFRPKADYFLENAQGRRVAWVDLSKIVIPGSISNYLDEAVIIHGPRDKVDSSRDWIIHARNMRLK
jgi:hypothetical protein